MNEIHPDLFWLSALALLGAAIGVFLFFHGFRMLQYKRLIFNTPFSKVRSASMGLVEISGTPTGPKTISSAITGSPCYYYHARAWQWLDSGKGGSWQQAVDESIYVPFFLEDATGKVLVNPRGATLDVHRSFCDEFRTAFLGKDSPVPESIRKFVATRGLLGGDKVRLEEHIIKPGFPLFVFGTLGDNNALQSWNAQPQVSGRKVSFGLTFGDSVGLNFKVGTNVSGIAAKALAGMLERTAKSNTRTFTYSSSDGGPVELPPEILGTLQQAGVNLPFPVAPRSGNVAVSRATSNDSLFSSRSMTVTIASDEAPSTEPASPQASATPENAGPNPLAPQFDPHTRVAISQGDRGDPFTISSQSQREVVQSLGWKSMACIWGGPLLALVCLYCLFVYWGWM